jgi:hypothetical protein
MEPLIIEATPDAPVACDMAGAPDTPEERLAEYGRLFEHALVGRQRTGEGVVLTLAAKPGVPEWLTDLVRREAACCPFFSYSVVFEDDRIVWTTTSTAGPAAQMALDELHGLPDHVAEGFDSYRARLADRGAVFTSPEPGRFTLST